MSTPQGILDIAVLRRHFDAHFESGGGAFIDVVDSIASTNAKLLSEAEQSATHFLIARQQTAGVGRRGGVWQSPPTGNLYLSYCFHTRQPLSAVALMPLAFGVEIAARIQSCVGAEIGIKWPNDLYLNGKKCGGILLETKPLAKGVIAVVVGVGLNVVSHPDAELLGRPTTCLQSASEQNISLSDTAHAVMTAIKSVSELSAREVSDRLLTHWPERDFLVNRQVKVSQGADGAEVEVRGVAKGIAPDGGLRVDCDGRIETFYAGEVSLGHVESAGSVAS